MKPTFLTYEKPTLAVLFKAKTPEEAIDIAHRAISEGAEGFCFQTCQLLPEYHNADNFRKIFAEMGGLPIYVTNYRGGVNENRSDEVIAEGLIELANSGATLCDVMGDMFDRQPGEMTMDPTAIEKQKELIDRLHKAGAEVLMSAHVKEYTPAERVLEIALAQQSRGADIVKIVTHASNVDEELENLRITSLLKKELNVPFLYLSGGECRLHRRIGPMLGCCMYLCSMDSAALQPQLWKAKAVRDSYDW